MANWCENKLTVKGKSEELVKLIHEHVVDDELDFKTFSMEHRLFGENYFDTDEILKEKIEEIAFWFSTKWTPGPGKYVCDEINTLYPSLEAKLSYFSVESSYFGYYDKETDKSYYLNDENVDEMAEEFIAFGEKEGFLKKTENGKYDFTHDVPTFRLLY